MPQKDARAGLLHQGTCFPFLGPNGQNGPSSIEVFKEFSRDDAPGFNGIDFDKQQYLRAALQSGDPFMGQVAEPFGQGFQLMIGNALEDLLPHQAGQADLYPLRKGPVFLPQFRYGLPEPQWVPPVGQAPDMGNGEFPVQDLTFGLTLKTIGND